MKCPHCGTAFTAHEDGRLHCNGCGCCFLEDGRTVRPGHPQCKQSLPVAVEDVAPASEPAADEVAESAPEVDPSPEVRPRRLRSREVPASG